MLPNSASSFCMLLSIAAPAGGQAVCPIRLDSNFEMACLGAAVSGPCIVLNGSAVIVKATPLRGRPRAEP